MSELSPVSRELGAMDEVYDKFVKLEHGFAVVYQIGTDLFCIHQIKPGYHPKDLKIFVFPERAAAWLNWHGGKSIHPATYLTEERFQELEKK
jgi:hypothetical protein